MGLPQISSDPVETCDLDSLHIENPEETADFGRNQRLGTSSNVDSSDEDANFPIVIRPGIQTPLSRVVGFDSSGPLDSCGLLLRKRLLSPLKVTVSAETTSLTREVSSFLTQDFKKANTGNTRCVECRVASWSTGQQVNESAVVDSPLKVAVSAEITTLAREVNSFLAQDNKKTNTGKTHRSTGQHVNESVAVDSRKKPLSSPLSLSPLGPKWRCGFALKPDMGSLSGYMKLNSPQPLDLDPLESSYSGQNWGPESFPPRFSRLADLPLRRSLVGSFEESLLSGRLSSSNVSQKIDGFLAVLKVNGGNFCPPAQKLPFSVTSVDGDSCLLYRASIDLEEKSAAEKLKDPQSPRMRIPAKGCIQLTFMRQRITLDNANKGSRPSRREAETINRNFLETVFLGEKSSLCSEGGDPSEKTSQGSPSKVAGTSSVLRYALHLRFLSSASKKASKVVRRCKSDPLSAPLGQHNSEGQDRRFYLYSDLKVVFPQRHTDADEGKLRVENHFPSDPKFFHIST
ncbi:uncharacterized protein LOC144710927 isoform X2 [Wolffia australiana]